MDRDFPVDPASFLQSDHVSIIIYPVEYARAQWPERLRSAPRVTVPLADPPPGDEAQVDFFAVGRWKDAESGRSRKLSETPNAPRCPMVPDGTGSIWPDKSSSGSPF